MPDSVVKFPKEFFWGAATSSHQVEGGNRNDWSEWEQKNAKRLAQNAKHNPPAGGWPNHILARYPNPLQEENYISGRATDHFHRFHGDFDIAKSLNHNAHRFSIEWSRIEPEEGKFDEQEIAHYREVIAALRERGLEPFVTLWHWPIPIWLRDKRGWEKRAAVQCFTRYVERLVDALKDEVNFWITLNEPEIYASNSYWAGKWPPQERSLISYLRVLSNLIAAHRAGYAAIKRVAPHARVGIAKNNIYFEAAGKRPINLVLKLLIDWWWNFYFLNRIRNCQDFIGLNHYFHNRIDFGFNKNLSGTLSDMSWELYPEAMFEVLRDLKRYGKPIYITENGLADARDEKRAWFIRQSLQNVAKAIGEGVDVRGYLYWSLLDNFEWHSGFWPRFGLVEVDYKTLERKIRPSAWEYKKIIAANAIEL